MDLGRYQIGDEVPLPLLCLNSSERPADPDEAPRVAVYGGAGGAVADFALPVCDKAETVGWFLGRLYLGGDYAEGHYEVVSRWAVGGTQGGRVDTFEVVAGGAESGQVIAMHSYERPHSNFMVQQRTSGRLYKGRNPRV